MSYAARFKYDVPMEEILRRLSQIEEEEQAHIFYACESGSRAWGFPSADSDYDVRFIYLRSKNWYLSIDVEDKRDVIERPINDELDISGWDLRKALKLLRKSNPPLLEWLTSPIVYREKHTITNRFRRLVPEFYSPIACAHHYLHMAQGNYREYLKGDEVRVKKYFYVLRPLLAIRWIEQESDVMPMEFGTLVEKSVDSPELRRAIEELLERKKAGQELDTGPRIEVISEFIERELRRLEAELKVGERAKPASEKLDEFFRSALEEIE
jgi:predicted nucleotidyltransferase